jgi:hypothetical protein
VYFAKYCIFVCNNFMSKFIDSVERLVPIVGKIISTVGNTTRSETCNVHSMESTESMAASQDETKVNLGTTVTGMKNASPGGVITTGHMQATSAATVAAILRDDVLVANVTLLPTTPVGTVIYSTPISPRLIASDTETRVAYLSRLYRFWSGDMTLRFIFTKTILIQTKLMAVFVPGATLADRPPTPAESTYYSHRVLMNPANEETYELVVPYVNVAPFSRMSETTGMVYVIVWQPLVVSVGDANSLPVSIMLSSTSLQYHEYDILPNIDNPAIPYVPPEVAYSVVGATAASVVLSAPAATMYFYNADGGALISQSAVYSTPLLPSIPVGAVRAADSFLNTTAPITYNPATDATLLGAPVPGEVGLWDRIVAAWVFLEFGTTDNYALVRVAVSTHGNIWFRGVPAVARTLDIFPSGFIPEFGLIPVRTAAFAASSRSVLDAFKRDPAAMHELMDLFTGFGRVFRDEDPMDCV